MPLTKSQIERLGYRLLGSSQPTGDDLAELHELLLIYGDALADTATAVQRDLGITSTPRIKTTGTILEKLERHGGSWLKSIQDIAGMRIVGSFGRAGQDALAAQLVELFADTGRRPKVVDRRADPSHGYRAVHVIVFVRSVPVEIQVRTSLQHQWADLFEKLADRIGRGIRYGEPPDDLLPEAAQRATSSHSRRCPG
jgi:ppGpp synthetase/RelA/SpoT-type nucleotidyltranferase